MRAAVVAALYLLPEQAGRAAAALGQFQVRLALLVQLIVEAAAVGTGAALCQAAQVVPVWSSFVRRAQQHLPQDHQR